MSEPTKEEVVATPAATEPVATEIPAVVPEVAEEPVAATEEAAEETPAETTETPAAKESPLKKLIAKFKAIVSKVSK